MGQGSSVTLELVAASSSVRAARAFVRSTVQAWGLDDELTDTASLLVSELATNAVLHARSTYLLEVQRAPDVLRVTVYDDSAARPRRRSNGLRAGTGRGLALVETLAWSWGTTGPRGARCKGVWFELALDPGRRRPTGEGALYGADWLATASEL